MKYIRLLIEYGAYPIWIYEKNEDEEFVDDTKIPDEWADNLSLFNLCNEIQNEFNSLFIDNINEFKYVGFKSLHD